MKIYKENVIERKIQKGSEFLCHLRNKNRRQQNIPLNTKPGHFSELIKNKIKGNIS